MALTKVTSDLIDIALLRGFLGGLNLSNDTGAPTTTVDVSAGAALDSTNSTLIKLPTAFTKILNSTGSWASGTGNNGLDTGARTLSTWYHVYVITGPTVSGDVIFSTSTAPALPANYTVFRRIGSVKTDGSNNVLAFLQLGDWFYWTLEVQDQSTTLSTAATNLTISAPLGVQTLALLQGFATPSGSSNTSGFRIYSPSQTDQAIDSTGNAYGSFATTAVGSTSARGGGTVPGVLTNTSSQVRAVASAASTTFVLVTYGWIDFRGRFS